MSAHFTRTLTLALVLTLGASAAFAATTGGRNGGSTGGSPGNAERVVASQQDCLALVACSPRPVPRPQPRIERANHCGTDFRDDAGVVLIQRDCQRMIRY